MSRNAVRFAVIGASLATALASAGSGDAAPRPEITSWAFAIGNGTLGGDLAERYADYDLVITDGEEARRREIEAIRSNGSTVLGYLSVGTIERWRGWYDRVKSFRLGPNADWKDEWYADVSRRGYRRAIAGSIAPRLLGKGFDGLFLDNTDMVEVRKPLVPGMEKLVKRLARLVHGRSGLLFTQNGAGVTKRGWLGAIDGWNREDVTGGYDFDHKRYTRRPDGASRTAVRELRQIGGAGVLTLSTDYTRRSDSALAAEAIARACGAGALPFVSDIRLTRVPRTASRCP